MRTKRRRFDSYPGSEGSDVPSPRSTPLNASAVIVLAAGSGTRMKSKTMKVLHPICGRSMVGHVLTAAVAVEARRLVAVVGHGREQVGPHVREHVPDAV